MNINLLPWREHARQRRCRVLIGVMAASAGLVLLPAAGLIYWGLAQVAALEHATALQQRRTAAAQEAHARLESDLLSRQATRQDRKILATWHRMRLDQLDVLMKLGELVSEAVSIERVRMGTRTLTLEGRSHTATGLALMLEQLAFNREQKLQSPGTQNLALDEKGELYLYRVGIPWHAAQPKLPGSEDL